MHICIRFPNPKSLLVKSSGVFLSTSGGYLGIYFRKIIMGVTISWSKAICMVYHESYIL